MSWIRLVAGPKSSSSWLILAQYIRKLGECGSLEGSGARAQGTPFFLKKECLFFFRDFEISPTISWMEEGESVESNVDSEIPGLSSADAIIAGSWNLPRTWYSGRSIMRHRTGLNIIYLLSSQVQPHRD